MAGLPGVDYRTPTGRQLTGMQAVAAEVTYYTNKERGEAIANRTVARGVPNRVPFGYRRNGTFVNGKLTEKIDESKDGKAIVPDPETAPILVRIFEMRADNYPWASIGRWLEDGGVTPPRGGSWAVSTLRNIISNEMYLGVITLGKRRIENAHEPLVTRLLWRTAQSSVSVKRTGTNVAGVAGGLLVCGHCHRRLSVTGTKRPSYTCRRTMGGKCEHPVYVSKARADAFVEHWIVEVLRQCAFEPVATSREIGQLRKRLADAKTELEGYVVSASALDAELFKVGLDARQAEVNRATEALDEALEDAEVAAELPSADGWSALDLARKRQVARALIERVVVHDAEASAEVGARIKGVERIPSRGRGADVESRLEIEWRGDADLARRREEARPTTPVDRVVQAV